MPNVQVQGKNVSKIIRTILRLCAIFALFCCAHAGAQTADLTITAAGPATANGGDNFTYTLAINNNGPDGADGTTFVDTPPAGVTNVTASCVSATGGAVCPASFNISTSSPQTVSGTITPFPALGGVTIQIQGRFPATGPSSLTNVATVSPPPGVTDPDPSSNSSSTSTALSYVADVQVIKTQSVSAYASGVPITYTITYTNNGPSAADGATLQDALAFAGGTAPYGTVTAQYVGCTTTGGATCPDPSSFNTYTNVQAADVYHTWTLNLFNEVTGAVVPLWPAGGVVTITYVVTHTLTAPPCGLAAGFIDNSASFNPAYGITDPDYSNNTSDVSLTTPASPSCPVADLKVADTQSPTVYTSGTPVTHTITITNNGPSSADGATISDSLNFFPVTSTAYDATFNAQFVSCVPSGGAVCPDATVFASPAGSVAGNTSPGNPYVALFAAPAPTLPSGGALTITYAITHTLGSAPCATPGGTITNILEAQTPNGVVDPTPNDTVETSLSTPAAPACLPADLSTAMTSSPTTYSSGTPITYTMVFTNQGPSAADGANISDLFMASMGSAEFGNLDLNFVSCSAANGAVCPDASQFQSFTGYNTQNAGGLYPFNAAVAAWPSGGTLTVVYTATYTITAGLPCGTQAGSLYTDAGASVLASTTVDPNPSNNSSFVALATPAAPDCPQADLSVTRTRSSTGFVSGAPATYTVTYSNNGPGAADGAGILDEVDLGGEASAVSRTFDAQFVGCTATGGAVCPTSTNFTSYIGDTSNGTSDYVLYSATPVSTWPAGGTLTITYTITVTLPTSAGACVAPVGDVSAQAEVLHPLGVIDPNTANNYASDDDTFVCADISVDNSVSPSSVNAADAVTYTIDVTNAGLGDAANVAFADPLPAGFVYANAMCTAKTGSPTCGAVTYDTASRTLASNITDMPNGSAVRFTVSGISDTTPGTYLNTASATLGPDFYDPILSSNTSSVNLQIFNTSSPVTITDALTGPNAGLSAPLTLTGSIVCGTQKTQNWSVTIPAGAQSASSAPLTFWDGDTCTVTQDSQPAPPAGYAWSGTPAISPNPTPTLASNAPLTVSISNALVAQGGGLAVTEHIAGPPAGVVQVSGTFQFVADCGTNGSFNGSATVVAGSDAVASIPNVPVGAQCRVSESNGLPAPPAGYIWAAVPAPQSITISANGGAVTVTNTLLAPTSAVPMLNWRTLLVLILAICGLVGLSARRARH